MREQRKWGEINEDAVSERYLDIRSVNLDGLFPEGLGGVIGSF